MPGDKMDIELLLLRALGRCLPPIPHVTSVINRVLKPVYLRKPRPVVTASAWGVRMRLNPAEAVDGGILFYPHLYNRREFYWLRTHLRTTDTFVDVGAHIGAYTLQAARIASHVIAIEANPQTFAILQENIRLNAAQVHALNFGVSDRAETLSLFIQCKHNSGGTSFVIDHGMGSINVDCKPLAELAPKADVMKLDIERMEYRVLLPYLEVCQPRMLILEILDTCADALNLCLSKGYRLVERTEENALLLR